MDCAKGTALAGLHDDLMVDILSRVPVKDLRRSMCVSKPWRDLVADPLHRKTLPQTLEGFFHGGAAGGDSYGHFISLSGRAESAPPVDPSFSFLTAKLPWVERMVLVDSCNGLLLFWCTWKNKFGYIVCNPATEEFVTVPASSASCPPPALTPLDEGKIAVYDGLTFAYTYLMFDMAVSSRFHLVQFWQDKSTGEVKAVHSYSSETRAWSDTSKKWEPGEERTGWGVLQGQGEAILEFIRGKPLVNGLLLSIEAELTFCRGRALVNGLLHFVVYHVEKEEHLIVAVDGEGKICRIICCPDEHVDTVAFIGQSQGHLLCISTDLELHQDYSFHFTQLSVWVLRDYNTQEWILKHYVSSLQLFGSLTCPVESYDIVAIHPDHKSIILVQHWNRKLVSYHMDSKELRALCTLGEGYRFITPYVPYFMESPVLATKDSGCYLWDTSLNVQQELDRGCQEEGDMVVDKVLHEHDSVDNTILLDCSSDISWVEMEKAENITSEMPENPAALDEDGDKPIEVVIGDNMFQVTVTDEVVQEEKGVLITDEMLHETAGMHDDIKDDQFQTVFVQVDQAVTADNLLEQVTDCEIIVETTSLTEKNATEPMAVLEEKGVKVAKKSGDLTTLSLGQLRTKFKEKLNTKKNKEAKRVALARVDENVCRSQAKGQQQNLNLQQH